MNDAKFTAGPAYGIAFTADYAKLFTYEEYSWRLNTHGTDKLKTAKYIKELLKLNLADTMKAINTLPYSCLSYRSYDDTPRSIVKDLQELGCDAELITVRTQVPEENNFGSSHPVAIAPKAADE